MVRPVHTAGLLTYGIPHGVSGQLPAVIDIATYIGVFGRGGVATWMVLTTAALWISKRGGKTAAVLLNLLLIFAIYAIYTSLFYVLSGAYRRRDSSRHAPAYLVAGPLSVLRLSGIWASRLRVCQDPSLSLWNVSHRRLYRRLGISGGGSPTVPRLAVGGDVSRIRSLCFRVASKETVWLSLLFATCSHRRNFSHLFWRLCAEESIYQ